MAHQKIPNGAPENALPEALQQRPGESWLAYHIMHDYVWMGPERSLAKLARKLNRGQSDRPDAGLTQLKKWSRRWDWQERAAAYDAEQLRLEIAYRDRAKRVDAVLNHGLNAVLMAIAKADPEKMTPADAAAVVALIDKVMRIEAKRQSLDQKKR